MKNQMTLRQILACLNISIFDSDTQPYLEKACCDSRLFAEKADLNRFLFYTGIWSAVLITFYGLLPYALPAGLILYPLFSVLKQKIKNKTAKYICQTYALSGFLLLVSVLLTTSPTTTVLCAFGLLFYYSISFKTCQQSMASALLCFGVTMMAYPSSVVFTACLFAYLGTFCFIFPFKGLYLRKPATVFMIAPLLLALWHAYASLWGKPLYEVSPAIGLTILAQSATLLTFLWRDLDLKEKAYGTLLAFFIFMISFWFCAGCAEAVILFAVAYFTDSYLLGLVALVLIGLFFIAAVFHLTLTLTGAAIFCAVFIILFKIGLTKIKEVK